MATDIVAPVPLKALARELGVASLQKLPVKIERSSSPPPLIEDTSGILETGDIDEQQSAVSSLQGELQLSKVEYSALEDRYKRLERQHSELQDLASAYGEVIRGFSPTDGQTVTIDQLQVEAGRDGLRAKALEADVLRPLVREAGGLQVLISQMNTMRTLVDKAGGLRELEQFVSDLRTIRDTLDEFRGSLGLVGLAAEVRDLLQSKQKHDGLAFEVDGRNGLREKATKYEKLAQAFADLQATSTLQRPSDSNAAMNPARARMISATPLEADPDRDLYEAPPPVAKPNNRTGSNNTPLGVPQDQPPESSLKRKGPEKMGSGVPAKRPRVDVSRVSALLPVTVSSSTDGIAGPKNPSGKWAGVAGVKSRTQVIGVHVTDSLLSQSNTTNKKSKASSLRARRDVGRAESGSAQAEIMGSGVQVRTTPVPTKLPDWMHSDVCFGDWEFASTAGGAGYSSTLPAQEAEPHPDASLGPVRFSMTVPCLPAFSSQKPGSCEDYLRHAVAFWAGASNSYAAWDVYQLYDLKNKFQMPGDVVAYLTGELSRLIPIAKYSTYETMAPSHATCILGYLIDGHPPSGVPQERTACRLCTQRRRPCAILQEIGGSQTIIFMPLRAEFRPGLRWSEKTFWIQGV